MLQEIISECAPSDWSTVNMSYNFRNTDYSFIEVPYGSKEFRTWECKIVGDFNMGVTSIYKLENPFLYARYLLKKEEYKVMSWGYAGVMELFHDTSEDKIYSIASGNLDWRLAKRVKFGKGVSFSPSPKYANNKSSRKNRSQRVMIIADVLMKKGQHVQYDAKPLVIPNEGYDTVIGNKKKVYVKFEDDEFYPKVFIFYDSINDY